LAVGPASFEWLVERWTCFSNFGISPQGILYQTVSTKLPLFLSINVAEMEPGDVNEVPEYVGISNPHPFFHKNL